MPKKLPNFYKLLFSIAIPIILQNLLQTFINMMDTIMVGRLGAVEIAAVGLGNQIFFMLNMVTFGISSGCSIFIAQFWGAKNIKGIRKTFGIMLITCFSIALCFMAAGTIVPEKLIALYTTDSAVIKEGARYLRICAFSYPLMAISFACQMAFRSTEHVVLPMVTTGISFVLNIIFNSLFIFGCEPLSIPKLGTAGAALATLISRFVEVIVTTGYGSYKKFEAMGKFAELLSFNRKFIFKLLKISLPVMLSETLWGLGITSQNSIFSHSGTDSFAAFSITNTVSQLTWVFFIGMGNASSIILGKQIGAGEEVKARGYANRFSWFFPLMGLLIGFLLFPMSKLLPFVFKVDPKIIGITTSLLYVLIFTYPFRAFNMLTIVGIFRAGGDTIFASIIDNGWMWALAIPLAYFASFHWGFAPWQIMLCLETEQILKALCGIIRIKSGKWLHNVTNAS